MINRLVLAFLCVVFGCMILLAVPAAVRAQDSSPIPADLIVTVRDVRGAPLAGLMVQIRAGADTPTLAQVVTNVHGQAAFAPISVNQVRVRVIGSLASGTRLSQPGADAQGIALFLGPPPTRLDLRVDSDGIVRPDPVTMIEPISNGPVIASPAPGPGRDGRLVFPTSATYVLPVASSVAAIATTSPMASAHPSSPAPVASKADEGAEVSAPSSASLLYWLVGIIGALALVMCGLLLIRLFGRRRI